MRGRIANFCILKFVLLDFTSAQNKTNTTLFSVVPNAVARHQRRNGYHF